MNSVLQPQTRASLERALPLEHFELTQNDCVMYYAFAEDNRPGRVQRTESDLRFIDIRPFRRRYRLVDLATGEGGGPRFKSLEEIIARQRYALNRTVQVARRFQQTGQADLAGIDGLIRFEAELATSTRELAEGLLARGIDETELLYQAETAMLAAADSLSTGKYDTATLQERDALKFLIEGRNRLEIGILKNRDRALLAQLRLFDRLQRQKLRRPKSDQEEAREVAERLAELAGREEFIDQALAGMPGQGAEQIQELEDSQLDVAVESREIETLLGRLKGITDLSKERMAAAAKTAEAAAEALGRQETNMARELAQSAGTQFRELARQVEALLAEEQAERIAAAQRIAAELAQRQRDFVDRLATGGTTLPGLEQQAEQIAETSQTLNDVLGAGSRATEPQEEPAAKRIGALVESLKLNELAERLKELPG